MQTDCANEYPLCNTCDGMIPRFFKNGSSIKDCQGSKLKEIQYIFGDKPGVVIEARQTQANYKKKLMFFIEQT